MKLGSRHFGFSPRAAGRSLPEGFGVWGFLNSDRTLSTSINLTVGLLEPVALKVLWGSWGYESTTMWFKGVAELTGKAKASLLRL